MFFRFDSTKGWDLGQYFESNPDMHVWAKHLPRGDTSVKGLLDAGDSRA